MPSLHGEGFCLWNLSTVTELMFFFCLQRFGYLQCRMTVAELMNKSDYDLFCKLCAPTHTLSHLLHPARNRASLRTRGHSYQLSEYSTYLHKKSFLIRCLYSFVKWNSFWFCCFVLYVILTLIFMFIIWCESVASNKITYIHNCSRAQCVSVTSST